MGGMKGFRATICVDRVSSFSQNRASFARAFALGCFCGCPYILDPSFRPHLFMRSFLLLVACFLGASSFARDPLKGRLPENMIPQMREIISVAMEESRTMEIREYSEVESEGRLISARSAVLPSFRTNVSFRQEKDIGSDADGGFDDRVVYNVTLSQPLYHWGTRRSQKELGELQYEVEKLNTQIVASEVVAKVREDFMKLIVAKQRLVRARLDLEQVVDRLDFQRKQVEVGAASELSLEKLELDVERKELSTLRIESDWDYKLEEFSNYVSMSPVRLEGLAVGNVPRFEILDQNQIDSLVSYYDQAVAEDERTKKSDINIEVNKRQLAIAEKSLRPMIDAELGMSSNALDLDGTRREQEYSYLGLSVGWTIFDGFRKKGRTMEALSRLSRAERDKRIGTENLVLHFDRLLRRLSIEGRALAIEERVLESATEKLDEVKLAVEEQRSPASAEWSAQRDYDNTLIRTQDVRISYLVTLSKVANELSLD